MTYKNQKMTVRATPTTSVTMITTITPPAMTPVCSFKGSLQL